MNDTVVNLRPLPSPADMANKYLYNLAEIITGMQELAQTPEGRKALEAISGQLANEFAEFRELAMQANGINLESSRTEDALTGLKTAAEDVRAIFHRSPQAIAPRMAELQHVNYVLSGVLTLMKLAEDGEVFTCSLPRDWCMTDITPNDQQAAAIKSIVEWYGDKHRQEFYLAGYAGVGKSTIAALAIEGIKKRHKKVKRIPTAAFTGKAASVLHKKGVENAQTVHSLIYTPRVDKDTGKVEFILSEDSEAANADLIVLDECSMVGDDIARGLRSFGKKILVIGDPGQLPPVKGQGAFTNREPDAFLTEIHRQAADSPILHLATLARQGKPLPRYFEQGSVRVLPLTKDSQQLVYEDGTQPLCGKNSVRWTYTQRVRSRRGFSGTRPLPGERVICCRNNRSEGLLNSLLGISNAVKDDKPGDYASFMLDVHMDDAEKSHKALEVDPYHFNNHFNGGTSEKLEVSGKRRLDEFDWGYILTTHKAQGSSWDHVTIVDDSAAFRDNRNA